MSRRASTGSKLSIAAGLGLVVGALVLLYTVKPDGSPFYPKCAFRLLTGLDCPGCGSLRALHRLLHGRLAEAWALNPLLVGGLLPCFLLWSVRCGVSAWNGTQPSSRLLPNWTAWLLLAAVLIFGVVRNTPYYLVSCPPLGSP